jgi:putative membrane protein
MSPEQALPPGPGHRLHRFAPLFEIAHNVWQALPTLAGMLLAAGSDRFARWGAIGLVVVGIWLLLHSSISAWRFRYWIDASDLVMVSGIVGRRVRRIPWARVENVQLRRNLLHRLTGVAEVVVEAGGASKAEAHLRVLSLDAAAAFEHAVRAHVREIGGAATATEATPVENAPLLSLGPRELVRAGLISNQGFVAVGAVIAASWQFDEVLPIFAWLRAFAGAVPGWIGVDHGPLFWVALAAGVAVFVLLLMRVLSISWWLLRYWNFELRLVAQKLSSEHGLLTRIRGAAHRQRVQRLLLLDGLLYRLLRRQAIQVGVAGQRDAVNAEDNLRWLAPVVVPERSDELLQAAGWPGFDRRRLQWEPLHRSAAQRVLVLDLLWVLPVLPWIWSYPGVALPLALLLSVLAVVDAWAYGRLAGHACDGRTLAFRHGFFDRQEWFLPIDRIESFELRESPRDRAHGTASLVIDMRTRGPGGRARIPYLPRADAEAIAARLRRAGRQ